MALRFGLLTAVALAAAAVLGTAPGALALDAAAFGQKFLMVYGRSLPADTLKFSSATATGDTIVLDGITLGAAGGGEATQLPITLNFNGVVEAADGSYTAKTLTLPDVDYGFEGGGVTVKNIIFSQLYLPPGTPSVVDSTRLFAKASVGPIVLSMAGAPAFTLDKVTVDNRFTPAQASPALAKVESIGGTTGMSFDMRHASDAEAIAQAKALGLEQLTGKFTEAGSWTLADGHLAITEVSIDLDHVGKFNFALDMTGYTPAFLTRLDAALQGLAAPGDDQQQGAAVAQLLGSLQAVFLNSLSLRFDDASITGRLLAEMAASQRIEVPALIEGIVAALPGQLAEGGADAAGTAVTKIVQAAVRAFLNDPHSIELKLAPPAPLGVLGFVAAASQPEQALDQLGLKFIANGKEITAADAAHETGLPPDDATGGDGEAGTAAE